jgi:hypothetical protein
MVYSHGRAFVLLFLRMKWPFRLTQESESMPCHAGVIWKGDKLIDGVPETLDMLHAMVSCDSIIMLHL